MACRDHVHFHRLAAIRLRYILIVSLTVNYNYIYYGQILGQHYHSPRCFSFIIHHSLISCFGRICFLDFLQAILTYTFYFDSTSLELSARLM